MIIKNILRFIILASIFNSCVSVGTVQLEVLKPPTDTLGVVTQEISLTNKFLHENQKSKSDFKNLTKYDKYRLDSMISVEALRTVYQEIENAGMVNVNTFDSLGKRTNISGTVVQLSEVDLVSKVETEPVFVTSRNAYYAAVMVPYRVKWELYNQNEMIDQTVYHDTVWAEGYKHSFEKLADLVRFNDVITYIIEKTAIAYASKISPTWHTATRYYVRNGNNDFYRAAYFMDDKKYDKAAEIWKKYQNAGNKTLAASANLNLAVYYELKGEIEAAIKHAQIAKDKGSDIAKKYLNLLLKRQKEINQLLNKG